MAIVIIVCGRSWCAAAADGGGRRKEGGAEAKEKRSRQAARLEKLKGSAGDKLGKAGTLIVRKTSFGRKRGGGRSDDPYAGPVSDTPTVGVAGEDEDAEEEAGGDLR